MEFYHLLSSTLLFLVLVACHANEEPNVYFKSMLPNTPMPKIIQDSLQNEVDRTPLFKAIKDYRPNDISSNRNREGSTSYVMGMQEMDSHNMNLYAASATDEQLKDKRMSSLYYLEKDMHPGRKINLHISKDTIPSPKFIPRRVADLMPLTLNKLEIIYDQFYINPGSVKAKFIRETVMLCERVSNLGEDKHCVTSLESMVDFVTSKIGKDVKAMSTVVNGNEKFLLQEYKVEELKKLPTDNVVVCHQEYYTYAVHYCHKSSNINAYMVSLVGNNNLKSKAISICHEDTSFWGEKHLAFQVLNVKPGTYPVCHFLVETDVAWVPY